jgi:hypothetical protein
MSPLRESNLFFSRVAWWIIGKSQAICDPVILSSCHPVILSSYYFTALEIDYMIH